MSEHLITSYGSLLKEDGSLREEGYATHLPFVYDKAAVQAPFIRIKEYDLYSIDDESYIVNLGLFKVSIITIIDIQIYNKKTKEAEFIREFIPDPLFRFILPSNSQTSEMKWKLPAGHVFVESTKRSRRLSVSLKTAQNDVEIEALIDQENEPMLVNCMSVNEDKRHFHYLRKSTALKVAGGFRSHDTFHEFSPLALCSYTWGRGAWNNIRSMWMAAAQGYQADKRIALSIGYGIGDTSKATQNALFVDGKIHKLEHINIGVRRNIKGETFYNEPWIISDTSGRVSLVFTPEYNKDFEAFQVGDMLEADQCLAYGTFSGSIELEDGSYIAIDELPGTALHAHLLLPFRKDHKIV